MKKRKDDSNETTCINFNSNSFNKIKKIEEGENNLSNVENKVL